MRRQWLLWPALLVVAWRALAPVGVEASQWGSAYGDPPGFCSAQSFLPATYTSLVTNDPGVAAFGLRNAVFALGDTFLEVVAPMQPDTAAGRYLERRGGDCGYMLIFQLDDLDAARDRVKEMGIRVVWQADLPDISGTHLHPADMRGAIVSLDRADPPGSWRWGGPSWTGTVGEGSPGRVSGLDFRFLRHASSPSRLRPMNCETIDGGSGTDGTGANVRSPSTKFELASSMVMLENGVSDT